jgi:hypothetical protein
VKKLEVDLTLIAFVKSGTKEEEYPEIRADLLTPVSKGVVKKSISEYKSNGPESEPAKVNVINTVILHKEI